LVVLNAKQTLQNTVLALANEKGIQLAAHYTRFFDLRDLLKNVEQTTVDDEEEPLDMALQQLELLSLDTLVLGMSEIIKYRLLPKTIVKASKPLSATSKPFHLPKSSTTANTTPLTSSTNSRPSQQPKAGNFQHRPHREHVQHPLSVVRLRGLPWTATEHDIINFFTTPPSPLPTPTSPTDAAEDSSEKEATPSSASSSDTDSVTEGLPAPKTVLILLNLHNRSTGEAYVEFSLPFNDENKSNKHTFAHRALTDWQGRHMGHRYIEIFPATPNELQYAQQMMTMHSMLVPNGVPPMGPPVMLPMPPQLVPIDLERSSAVRIRGMPFSTTIEEIVQFFDPLLVEFNVENRQIGAPIDIIPVINAVDGRPTGDAFIKFKDAKDAKDAVSKSKQKMGGRFVDIFKIPEQEIFLYSLSTYAPNGALPMPPPMNAPPFFIPQESPYMIAPYPYAQRGPRRAPRSNGTSSQHHYQQHLNFTEHVVRVRGLPFTCDEGDIADFFHGLNIAHQGIHLILNESNDRSTGEALVEFASEEDVELALKRHRQMIGKRYIEVFRSNSNHQYNNNADDDESDEEKRNFGPNTFVKSKRPPRQNTGRVFFNGKLITSLPPQVGMDGVMLLHMPPHLNVSNMHHHQKHHRHQYYEYGESTVRMRGLPFSSNNEDIIQFFSEYELDINSIQMRVDGNGRKNGEAYVNFSSGEEARRAVEGRNRCHMGNRYIELFLVGVKHNEGFTAGADQTDVPTEVEA
jgi:RNA recognition motif-containing protein